MLRGLQTMSQIWANVIAHGPVKQASGDGSCIGWARPYAESPAMFRARLRLLFHTMAPHGWAPSDFAAIAPWAMHLIAGPPDAFLHWWQQLSELFASDNGDPFLAWLVNSGLDDRALRPPAPPPPKSGPYSGVRSQTITARCTEALPATQLHRAVLALRECIFTASCAPPRLRQHLSNLVAAKYYATIDDAARACMSRPSLMQPSSMAELLQLFIVIRAFEGPVDQAGSAFEVARQRQLQLPALVARMMLWKGIRCAAGMAGAAAMCVPVRKVWQGVGCSTGKHASVDASASKRVHMSAGHASLHCIAYMSQA